MNKEEELKKVKVTGSSYRSDCRNCGRILKGSKEVDYCEDCQRAINKGRQDKEEEVIGEIREFIKVYQGDKKEQFKSNGLKWLDDILLVNLIQGDRKWKMN